MNCATLDGVSLKPDDAECDYKKTDQAAANWPPVDEVQYFGRGPLQLSYNYNYGAFSNAFGREYDSSELLLDDPKKVVEDGYVAFASALWFYMTP